MVVGLCFFRNFIAAAPILMAYYPHSTVTADGAAASLSPRRATGRSVREVRQGLALWYTIFRKIKTRAFQPNDITMSSDTIHTRSACRKCQLQIIGKWKRRLKMKLARITIEDAE